MRTSRRFRVLVLVAAALFLVGSIGGLRPLERVSRWLMSTVQGVVAPLRNWQRHQVETNDLRARLAEQQGRIATLEQENTKLFSENDALRQSIGNARSLAETNLTGIESTVLGRSPEGENQVFLVNRGTSDGVSEGLAVVNGDGVFLGRVQRPRAFTSFLQLPTSATSSLGAEVQNDAHSGGLLQGEHGLSLLLTLLPIEDTVVIGQRVVTSALDINVPAGLLIGTISEIRKEEGGLFQTAVITAPVSYDRVRAALILLPKE